MPNPPTSAAAGAARLEIGVVDVLVVRRTARGWRVLVLQRAADTRCSTAWETVHGRIEPGEWPEDAAVREVREETGLAVDRLYNVTCSPFYLHGTHTVQVAVVFAAVVTATVVVTGPEHARAVWLAPSQAARRFAWPREREHLGMVMTLLRTGDGGPVDDVLRVR